MRILVLAVCLSGCGSACSSSLESAPEPASAANASQELSAGEKAKAAGTASSAAKPEPEPAPPPEPIDPDDTRVVYENTGARTKVRFAATDDLLLVADVAGDTEVGERVSLQDAFGRVRWSHDYTRVDDVEMDAKGAYATADGHLYSYDLESGQPTDLGPAAGQLVVTPTHVYAHSLGLVERVARQGGGKLEKVVHYDHPGFHVIDVEGEALAMLASAYHNRPARFPKPGALLLGRANGGDLSAHFASMYSPGPLLHLEGGYAYFGASDEAEDDFEYRIVRVPLEGRAQPEEVVHHPIAVFEVEGDKLFAAARLGERAGLFAFSTGEGEPVLMSAFEGGATAVDLSEHYVYWESRGHIYRVEKDLATQEATGTAETAEAAETPKPTATAKKAKAKAKAGTDEAAANGG